MFVKQNTDRKNTYFGEWRVYVSRKYLLKFTKNLSAKIFFPLSNK